MSFFSALGKGFRRILDFGRGVRNVVRRVYNTAKQIPVVSNLVSMAEATPIGQQARRIAEGVSAGIDAGGAVADTIDRIRR
jgi:hypothetical protein